MIMKEQIYLVTLKAAIDYLSPGESENFERYLLDKMEALKSVSMVKGSDIEDLREKYTTYESLLKLV